MIPIVQKEIKTFVDVVWNTHRIREQKNTCLPDGVPNRVYNFPERYGLQECGMNVHFVYKQLHHESVLVSR